MRTFKCQQFFSITFRKLSSSLEEKGCIDINDNTKIRIKNKKNKIK